MTVTLEHIRLAADRLQDVAIETPLLRNHYLDRRIGAEVYIKPECLQHIGAFKFRGAYNRLSQLNAEQRQAGVVAYSSGNHAQGVALAAQLLDLPATIVMPHDAPRMKRENTERLGATVRLYHRDSESREAIAADIAAASGATIVPAFDDADIIAGQGTCGLEIVEQLAARGREPQLLLSPCGGGGLLAGCSTAVRALSPAAQIYGVEPAHYDDHAQSRRAGERRSLKHFPATRCDALMAPEPGLLTWDINRRTVTDFLVVSEAEVSYAVCFAFRYLKLVVEPGGAVALAALLAGKLDVQGRTVALILSGGNVDRDSFHDCLREHPDL